MSSIVPASSLYLEYLARHMRQSDKDEVKAGVGMEPLPALQMSLVMSSSAFVMLDGAGTPFVIFGCAPLPGHIGVGVPWLLGTPLVEKHRIFCLKTSLRFIDTFLQEYEVLLNYVDIRNRLSIEWITWCGFQIADYQHEFGVEGRPFLQFSKMRG